MEPSGVKIRRYIFLALWCLAIIVPTAVFSRISPVFRRMFNSIFSPPWVHVLMHLALFAVLVLILVRALSLPIAWRTILIVSGGILGIGLLQEGFQALEQGYLLPAGALIDLAVDFCGGLIGLAIIYGLAAAKSRAYWAS